MTNPIYPSNNPPQFDVTKVDDDELVDQEQEVMDLTHHEINQPKQKNKERCWTCKKNVGPLGFKCRCQYIFCSKHSFYKKHYCNFDYRSQHQQQLKKNNPKIEAKKLKNKI